MERPEAGALLVALAAAPDEAAALLGGLASTDLRWHPRGPEWTVNGHHAGWSLAQHSCHLRDLEREGYGLRIERFLLEANPLFPDVDGDRLAAERDYDSQDVAVALADFRAARARSLEAARQVLARAEPVRGRLDGVGPIGVVDLLLLMSEHDTGHLAAMRRLRDQQHERPER